MDMDFQDTLKALAAPTRQKLIELLSKYRNLSAVEIFKAYNKEYDKNLTRDTIYRHLEKLVEVEILEKEYITSEKRLVYNLKVKVLTIDLEKQLITIKTD